MERGYTNSDADEAGILKQVVGARLTSVCFVMDYLILGFDERGALTSLVWPEIMDPVGGITIFEDHGYRDRVCDLITQVVADVQMAKDETILIIFENGSRVTIRLRDREDSGERAIFTAPKHQLQVW